MRIVNFNIKDGMQEIAFQREYIEESGRMDTHYVLWRDQNGELLFGITDSKCTYGIGIKTKPNLAKIITYLQDAITTRTLKIKYSYLPAPAEDEGLGVVQEVIFNSIQHTIPIDVELIGYLQQIIDLLKHH